MLAAQMVNVSTYCWWVAEYVIDNWDLVVNLVVVAAEEQAQNSVNPFHSDIPRRSDSHFS